MNPLFFLAAVAALVLTPLSSMANAVNVHPNPSTRIQQQMLRKFQNMAPEERHAMVRSMIQSADVMQRCVENAGGHEAINELQQIGEAHYRQVKDLCKDGKREQAQAYAHDVVQDMRRDPRISKLQNCSSSAIHALPHLEELMGNNGGSAVYNKHVCDN